MTLTPEQLQIIRESTHDEAALQRVLAVIDDLQTSSPSDATAPDADTSDHWKDEQMDFLASVIDKLPVSIYIKDRESRFVMANRYTRLHMDLSIADDIIGKTDYDLLYLEDATQAFEQEQKIIQGGQPVLNYEVYIDEKYGEPRWLLTSKLPLSNSDGQIIGLVGINLDITQQKMSEKKLENERNLLQTLIDHIDDPVYIKDRQSRFILANKATLRDNRLDTIDQIIGTRDFDHTRPKLAQTLYDVEQHLMETGEPIIEKEMYIPPDDTSGYPEPSWVLYSKVPVYDSDGKVIGLVGINRDITRRKLESQKELKSELENQKSEFLMQFISSASHEFRTPISIIGSSTYLLERVTDADKRTRHITQINQQAKRLERLINSMLIMVNLDRMTDLEKHPIRLNVLLENAIEHVKTRHEDTLPEIRVLNRDEEVRGHCSETLLFNAVCEILDNAVRFTPKQGTVTVDCQADDTHITMTIRDTGKGMSDETLDLIFQRFYREDKSHTTSGFGLGLPIAQQIIQLHGGDIHVESEVDAGTTVTIQIPQEVS